MRPLLSVLFLATTFAGCGLSEPDPPQPLDLLRLPASLAIGGDGDRLYAVGTNFDLGYGTGALQSLDVAALNTRIGEPAAGQVVRIEDPPFTGAVNIGSFGGNIAVVPTETGERLFVPSRADGTVAVIDVAADGDLSCVPVNAGGDGGEDCRNDAVRLFVADEVTMDDPFSVTWAGDDVFVGSLSAQPVDPDVPAGAQAVFMARLPVSTPEELAVEATIALSGPVRSLGWLRDLATGPDGRVYGAGTNSRGDLAQLAPIAEVRSFAPGAFSADTDFDVLNVSAAVGPRNGQSLRFSGDGEQLYFVGRDPDALVIFQAGEGAAAATPVAVVPLPGDPSNLALIPRDGGELVVVTCPAADSVVIVDPVLAEVVAILDGSDCPEILGVCPVAGQDLEDRDPPLDPGVQPYGVVVTDRPGGGVRIWVSSFGDGTLRAIDVPEIARPWDARVVAVIGTPAEEES